MPYKSRAQQKYFHYLESKGKMPKKVVDEFDDATKDYDDLPENMFEGGMAVDDQDHEMGPYNWHRRNSSGEPHTNDKFDDEQDMEFMFEGGIVPPEHGDENYSQGDHGYAESPYGRQEDDRDNREEYLPAGKSRAHLAHGGRVRNPPSRYMADGGRVNTFAQALMRKARGMR